MNAPYCQNCGQPTNSGFVCAACHLAPSRAITFRQDQQAQQIQDMAMLLKRSAKFMDQPNGHTLLSRQIMDYLRRHGLLGSPLRNEEKP